jgi:acetyl-CoA acetyltransferase
MATAMQQVIKEEMIGAVLIARVRGHETEATHRALADPGHATDLARMQAAHEAGKLLWIVDYYGPGNTFPPDCDGGIYATIEAAEAAGAQGVEDLDWVERYVLRPTIWDLDEPADNIG